MDQPKQPSHVRLHGGTIRVRWEKCPNWLCPSREWPIWHVDYRESDFWCGTCTAPLKQPKFEMKEIKIKGDHRE